MSPLFVSYFTPAYAAEAAGLIQSLRANYLDHDVRQVPSRGSWQLNTSYKPTFLCRMREEHPKRSLVWVDADARIVGNVSFFDQLDPYDLAVHYFRDQQVASGTVFLGCTHESYELARRWAWRCDHHPELLDQKALQVEAEGFPGLKIHRLPASLCYIRDLTPEYYADVEPAILHRQSSRKFLAGAEVG